MKKMNQAGFTLLEILVVVLIIGILAAIAFPQYRKAIERMKAAEAMTYLDAVAKAETVYFMNHDTYTTNSSVLDFEI